MKTTEGAVKRNGPWRSLSERTGAASAEHELPAHVGFEIPSSEVTRRRFLGLLGATAALAGATSCSGPRDQEAVVPYSNRPEEITPGVANFYATTYQEAQRSHGVLVKTREGRPIHIEGNDLHPLAQGKVTARTQAQVLSLYDPDRLRQPLRDGVPPEGDKWGVPASWDDALGHVLKGLQEADQAGRGILLVTGAIVSPSRRALLAELAKALPTLRHVAWEPAAFR
ncbi:MAG: twin-arginine translocation signal domain-containing protein, partial [bacterium]|nr:twin-arginine translocation signal domain-containing protein [bacterium]